MASATWVMAGVGTAAVVAWACLIKVRSRPARAARLADAASAELAGVLRRAAVLVRDLDGVILHWSPGCEHLFGYNAAEALGQRQQDILGTRFPSGSRRAAQAALQRDGTWQGELRHRRRNGQAIVVISQWFLSATESAPSRVVELHTDGTGLRAADAELRAGEARLLLAQEVAGVEVWEWNPESDVFSNAGGLLSHLPAMTPAGAAPTLDSFLALVHPADRARIRAAMQQALVVGEYEAEFRVLSTARDGRQDTRWLIGRGRRMPGPAGEVGPLLGVHMDISARKDAEERQTLLMREVDHRAKNALAVVQAVLRLTRADTSEAFAQAISGRVASLARAQTLLTDSRWQGADLETLIRGELSAFIGAGATSRLVLSGPPVVVTATTAQPLSMALHELATNAAKYGCLSVDGGTLDLAWSTEAATGDLQLRWVETGGPSVLQPPGTSGFGSRMIRSTIEHQLGGRVTYDWARGGLICRLLLPPGRCRPAQQRSPAESLQESP